jgi:hypothetical protein
MRPQTFHSESASSCLTITYRNLHNILSFLLVPLLKMRDVLLKLLNVALEVVWIYILRLIFLTFTVLEDFHLPFCLTLTTFT